MLDMGETGMPVPELCRGHGISSVTKNLPHNDFGLITMSARIRRLEDTINAWIDRYYDPEKFLAHIEEKYELDRDGFYHWDGIRYFLYEHEQWLREKGKQATRSEERRVGKECRMKGAQDY